MTIEATMLDSSALRPAANGSAKLLLTPDYLPWAEANRVPMWARQSSLWIS